MTAWHATAPPFPANHPCLAGHFPGNPLIPGTLILERVVECLGMRHPQAELGEILWAKFLHPLKPDQEFNIFFRKEGKMVTFECRLNDTLLTTGKLSLASPGTPG